MSLFTPEFGLAFWMLVVFLILFGILAKFAWPAIMRGMDERAAFIDKGVEYAREAQAEREKAKADVQALLAEAHQQQLEVLQQTERLKREIIAKAQETAAEEAKRIGEAAQADVGIAGGECTADGKFSLDACRCVGACGLAPVLMVNDDVYGRLTVDDLDGILEKYK